MNNTDPWEGRSEGMRCLTCMWYASKGNGVIGRCRRHAPTMNGYPVVFPADWCGDHKLNEQVMVTGAQTPKGGAQ
ncbi:MAG: hypothetical protein ACYDCO_01800 [Armatimonadota bacterium]